MRFRVKNQETTSFKKRYKYKTRNIFLRFGTSAFIISKTSQIEFNYIAYFKKILKLFFKFKKTKLKKVWLFLNKNFPITKKSKNARMGKGKGKFLRYCMRTNSNYTILEFSGFNIKSLLKINKLFNFRLKAPILLYNNFLLKKNSTFFSKSEYFYKVKYRNL